MGLMLAAVLGAALVWPYLCARVIETKLQAWVQASDPQGEWVWQHLVHERGWLRSRGQVELVVRARCSADADLRQGGVLMLRYELLHWPTLTGASSFSWQLQPANTAQGRVIRALLGTQAAASGEGAIGWDRSVRSSFHLPAWQLDATQVRWHSGAAHGQLSWTARGLTAQAKLAQLTAQRADWRVQASGLALQVSWPPGPTGLGDVKLQAQALQGPTWRVQDWGLRTQSEQEGGKLASAWQQHIGQLHWGEHVLRDVQLDVAVSELDAQSVGTLGGIFAQSCRLERLSPEDGRPWRLALRALLNRGLRIEVSKLAGQLMATGDAADRAAAPSAPSSAPASPQSPSILASLTGRWSLTLLPHPVAGRVALAQSLVSSGQLSLRTEALSPLLRESALASGYFTATPDGLEGGYRYANGQLHVSGQTLMLDSFQRALGVLDLAIQSWLNPEQVRRDDPVDALPEGVEPPSALPDPTPSEAASASAPG